MKDDTLEKAKELKKKIGELTDHFENISKKNDEYKNKGNPTEPVFKLEDHGTTQSYGLIREFMPLLGSDIMTLYIFKVNERIKSLKAEYDEL